MDEELTTLDANLRSALQRQRAAYEQMRETQQEIESLMLRASDLLSRSELKKGTIPEQHGGQEGGAADAQAPLGGNLQSGPASAS